jgi:preprotein translocase subunit SecF
MEFFKSDKIYDFMKYRIPFLGLSLFLFVSSLILVSTKGLNFGIDFVGGSIIQVKYEQAAPLNSIREELSKHEAFKSAVVTEFGSSDEVVIKITNTSTELGSDIGDQISSVLKTTGNFELRRVDMVGPKVGNELREKGIIALVLALSVILIYVSYRFEWRFAVSSILALIHDLVIAIGAISLFSVEVNLDILAALLTVLGYSINDTIIVFDRVREKVSQSSSSELTEIINDSVSNTLSRTTLTSFTTLLVVITLYIFGSEIISGFSFTLLVGIVVGTYSSIFVASTFLGQLQFSVNNFRQKEAEKLKKQKEKDRIRAMYEKGVV